MRCKITAPSECRKKYFLTKLLLNVIDEYVKRIFFSPSFHQDIYQNTNKGLSTFIPLNKVSTILIEGGCESVFEELSKDKNFEKSDTETETYERLEELKYPQE